MTIPQKYEGVLVFSESPSLVPELLSKGRELSDKLETHLAAVALGDDVSEDGNEFAKFGADKIYLVQDRSLRMFEIHAYAAALSEVIRMYLPDVVLIGATRSGLELAPRVAERLETGCCTDCTKLDVDAERKCVIVERLVFGGNVTETLVVRSKPQIFTVPKGMYQPLERDLTRIGETTRTQPRTTESPIRVLDRKAKRFGGVRIAEAEAIVSFGRGLRRREDIPIIEELARSINGVVGCSRPVAEDLKWLPVDQYVGLSGQKVAPKVYIACGISGQIQHITGIQNARIIVSINADPEAPIFEYADYGIVGDLYKVVPELTEAFRRLLNK